MCYLRDSISAISYDATYNLALQISPELLKKFIVVLTVILLIVMVANPRLGVVNGSYEAPPNHRKARFRHLRWLLWSRSGDFPILHLNSRFPSDLSGKCC
jgi:hypothetical protein